jgi:short chain dehydrogenase
MQRLKGKVAIITGGAGGIGAATATRFVDEGARVVLADIDESKARSVAVQLGEAASAMYVDGADPQSVKSLCDWTAARFGRIDILHNNHALLGGLTDDKTAVDTEFAVWDRAMAINLRGYFAACISQRKFGDERHGRTDIVPDLFIPIGTKSVLDLSVILKGKYRVWVFSFFCEIADPVEADSGNRQLDLERAAAIFTHPFHPANRPTRFVRWHFRLRVLGG